MRQDSGAFEGYCADHSNLKLLRMSDGTVSFGGPYRSHEDFCLAGLRSRVGKPLCSGKADDGPLYTVGGVRNQGGL